MSYILMGTILLLMMATSSGISAQDMGRLHANVGLLYPLSSNGVHAIRDTNNISLNAIAGLSASERGCTISGISNIVRLDASGFQLAGLSNHLGGDLNGFMVSGILNTYCGGSGVSIAGIINIAGHGTGIQIAGLFNKGSHTSLQVGGLINHGDYVKIAQLGGLLNTARKSKGIQVGLINVADSAGTQIGLLNFSKNGESSLSLNTDETQTTIVSYRSGGKVFYGIIGIGYNFNNKSQKYAYQAGIGARLLNYDKFRLKTELIASGLENFKGRKYFRSSSYLMPAFRLGKSIEIFAGPSFNSVVTDTEEGKNLIKHYVSDWTSNNGRDFHGIYFGYTAGIQLSL